MQVAEDAAAVRVDRERLRQMLEAAGLRVEADAFGLVQQTFGDWTRRAGVPQSEADALRASFLGAPPEARAAFRIRVEGDGTLRFAWNEIVILGIKP